MSDAMTEPARHAGAPDPTFYPVEEQVGDRLSNREMASTLKSLVERWLAERGEHARVGTDQFIYWVQHKPTLTLAPDLYVLPGVDAQAEVTAWKVWETGIAPSVCVEIVSSDKRKDYEVNPPRYDELGVRELIVFDPDHDASDERTRFQVWHRRRGELVCVERTNRDRVRSTVLGCYLRDVGTGGERRLRLATGRGGDALLATAEERESQAERDRETAERERDAERRGRDAAERDRDAERRRREAAEEELARLRAELEAREPKPR
jgi:Uma2 family endonuclease